MQSSTSDEKRKELELLRMAWLGQVLESEDINHPYHQTGGTLDWFRMSKVEYGVLLRIARDWVKVMP